MKITQPHRGRSYQTKELMKNLIGLKSSSFLHFNAPLYYQLVTQGDNKELLGDFDD